MQRYWLTRLADHELIHEVTRLIARERQNTADLLAHLAEVDARKLYAPAGYDSMYAWCVGVLGFSEDVACKRIEAARTARRFPAVFDAIATGRLHLSGVLKLAPHLTPENATDLLAAAAGRTRAQIAELLAERFPRPDVPTHFALTDELALAAAGESSATSLSAPGRIDFAAAEQMATPEACGVTATDRIADRAGLTPLSSDRVALQATLSRRAAEQLRYAQALLGHAVAPGDVAGVLERALDLLVEQLEKRRFAKCARSQQTLRVGAGSRRVSDNPRHIPAHVRREVWERDRGGCTFVSADGHVCASQGDLEFDHVVPVARGGLATTANIRLRCHTHNQHAADQTFGAGFMDAKRARTRAADALPVDARNATPARVTLTPSVNASSAEARWAAPRPVAGATGPDTEQEDMLQALRVLGARSHELRRAVADTAHMQGASAEARLRVALRAFVPAGARPRGPVSGAPA